MFVCDVGLQWPVRFRVPQSEWVVLARPLDLPNLWFIVRVPLMVPVNLQSVVISKHCTICECLEYRFPYGHPWDPSDWRGIFVLILVYIDP